LFYLSLVKAVQELSRMNDAKDAKVNAHESRLKRPEELIDKK